MKTNNKVPFDVISFTDKKLKITKEGVANPIYNEPLTTPVWLNVESGGDWKVIVNQFSPITPPKYKCVVPFGKENALADIIFGKIESKAVLEIQIDQTKPMISDQIALAKSAPGFYVILKDTIGTDDLRNGKVNVNIFSIEKKDVYLKLIKGQGTITGAEYDLEIGYN